MSRSQLLVNDTDVRSQTAAGIEGDPYLKKGSPQLYLIDPKAGFAKRR